MQGTKASATRRKVAHLQPISLHRPIALPCYPPMPRLTLYDGSFIIARLHVTKPDGECALDTVLGETDHDHSTVDLRCSTTVKVRNDERLSASINLFHILKQRQSSNLDKTLRTDYRYEARIFVNDESVGQRSFTMEELGDLKSTIFTPAICISPCTRVIGLQVCETECRPSGRQRSTTYHFEFQCSTGSATFHHTNTPMSRACARREMERVTKKSNRPWYTGGERQESRADSPPPSLMQRLSVPVSGTAQPLSARLSERPSRKELERKQNGRRSVSRDSSTRQFLSMGDHVADERSCSTDYKRREATTRSDEIMNRLQELEKSFKMQGEEGQGLERLEDQQTLECNQRGNAQQESAHNRPSRVEHADDDSAGMLSVPHTPRPAGQDSQKAKDSHPRPQSGQSPDHEPLTEVCSYELESPPRPDADTDAEQGGSKRGRDQPEKRSIEYYRDKRVRIESHRKNLEINLEIEKEKLLVSEEVDKCRELEEELHRLRKRRNESLRTEAYTTPDDAHFSRLLVSRPIPAKDATLALKLDKHCNEQQRSVSSAAVDERPFSPQSMKSHSDDGHRQSPALLSSSPTLPAPLMRNR